MMFLIKDFDFLRISLHVHKNCTLVSLQSTNVDIYSYGQNTWLHKTEAPYRNFSDQMNSQTIFTTELYCILF